MIANCPGCGTHYKHDLPKLTVRARCGRCDTWLNLARLSPYRIVTTVVPRPEETGSTRSYSPIGLDDPSLATVIARNVARPGATLPPIRPPDIWENEDPLPQIPEMTSRGAFPSTVPLAVENDILQRASVESPGREAPRDEPGDASSPAGGRAATFALWVATGAIAGTGASWTMGGTTMMGVAVGAVLGAAAGWGWLRWTSPK